MSDPIAVIGGSTPAREFERSAIVLVWRCIGFLAVQRRSCLRRAPLGSGRNLVCNGLRGDRDAMCPFFARGPNCFSVALDGFTESVAVI
jgi:hypothetical protein